MQIAWNQAWCDLLCKWSEQRLLLIELNNFYLFNTSSWDAAQEISVDQRYFGLNQHAHIPLNSHIYSLSQHSSMKVMNSNSRLTFWLYQLKSVKQCFIIFGFRIRILRVRRNRLLHQIPSDIANNINQSTGRSYNWNGIGNLINPLFLMCIVFHTFEVRFFRICFSALGH